MKLPDFFICGAAKAGTTSLWRYLNQHPSIYMPEDIKDKEPGYFSNLRPISDLDPYAALFKNAGDNQVVGEASGAYLTSPDSAARIYSVLPNAKIIIMLRNPVDRAFSLYQWMVKEGYEYAGNFKKALAIEEKERFDNEVFKQNNPEYYYNYLYFNSGLYSVQIKRYLNYFPKEQLHFIVFEKFVKNPIQETHSVYSFLGVNNKFTPQIEVFNKGTSVRSVKFQFFNKQYLNRLNILKRTGITQFLMNCNSISGKKKLDPKLRKKLIKNYTEDIYKTEDLININLSKYWL